VSGSWRCGWLALLQAVLSTLLSIGPLGLDIKGPACLLMVIAILGALLGLALGLLVSAFARNEFQAVQSSRRASCPSSSCADSSCPAARCRAPCRPSPR
jgi:hypothetical protein